SWPGAGEVIAALARAIATVRVQVVAGDQASGAGQIVDGAIRRWQLDEAAQRRDTVPIIAGSLDAVAARVGVLPSDEPVARWLDRVGRVARKAPALVVFELGDDPRAVELVAAIARAPALAVARAVIAVVDAKTSADDRTPTSRTLVETRVFERDNV